MRRLFYLKREVLCVLPAGCHLLKPAGSERLQGKPHLHGCCV